MSNSALVCPLAILLMGIVMGTGSCGQLSAQEGYSDHRGRSSITSIDTFMYIPNEFICERSIHSISNVLLSNLCSKRSRTVDNVCNLVRVSRKSESIAPSVETRPWSSRRTRITDPTLNSHPRGALSRSAASGSTCRSRNGRFSTDPGGTRLSWGTPKSGSSWPECDAAQRRQMGP